MNRTARRLLAATISVVLVALSPGLDSPRLFAQAFTRAASAPMVRAVPGAVAAPAAAASSALAAASARLASVSSPALTPPAALAAVPAAVATPAAAVAAAPAARAASLPEMTQALAAPLAAAADAKGGSLAAAAAGQAIENIITGAAASAAGDAAGPAGRENARASALAASGKESSPAQASAQPAVPAPAAAASSVESEWGYRARRFLLKSVAALTGAVHSLPQAGPALSAKLIARAAGRTAVISDYDDTLASFNQVLPQDMVDAVKAVKAAGKTFSVISDRGDEKRPGSMTVFESLSSIPADVRAGMYMAANTGGRVYRFDEKGEPVKVFEAPVMTPEVKTVVAAAAEAMKSRLSEVGAVQHDGKERGPGESWGPYSYALMLKPGSSEAQVRGAAALLREELSARGSDLEVTPRFAKDPANPPYVVLSVITKADAAAYIAKQLGVGARQVVITGDSMYAPQAAKTDSWLSRLGARVAGRPMPSLGNRTDANMEKGVPGALTLSVGETGDPRPADLWVLAGKGPSVTRQVLLSVASKTRAQAEAAKARAERIGSAAGAAALIAATVAAYYLLIHGIADWLGQAESILRSGPATDIFGAATVMGAAGTLGLGRRDTLSNPVESYAEARKKAVEVALRRGAWAGQVQFVQATAAMPVNDGAHWTYTFAVPGAQIAVGYRRVLGGALEAWTSVYDNAPVPAAEGRVLSALEPTHFSRGVRRMDPETALDLARKAGLRGSAAVSLEYREEPVSGDKDLWYRFFGDASAASVNARTGEVRVSPAAPAAAGESDGFFREMLIGLGGLAVVLAIYGAMAWAFIHAPAAPSTLPSGVPGNIDIGHIFGAAGTLGVAGAAAAAKRAKKAKPALSDDDVRARAGAVISYKGYPWSSTEYNSAYYPALETLRAEGATDAQLELFKKICADAPLKGGRFNPWSGD